MLTLIGAMVDVVDVDVDAFGLGLPLIPGYWITVHHSVCSAVDVFAFPFHLYFVWGDTAFWILWDVGCSSE